ncbi:cell division septum initiation protein DivIVA [Halopolyspora algeriensis]|uniref:Cell division septum initiation protein DivIVA n=1 Tax=Halopolyspora algeriensis TaxID=1500506 RepID=A0A368VT58_9ACTN|nr:hypothetical protein [Halopolyspora algeriensis]RCW45170.1 cell division septum initiation protein DivIVA [Halopolyspora algeriensis]TQM53111.1 cell division septum initiation protein DivIVA [Halopolyspora algeriensis]
MNDETVVPLRPGFDNEFRGFNRKQVLEHIELLEDQVKMLTTDRDEAMRLNEDQRRITDETRHRLETTMTELRRIETSETGLPHATRRMQNMLMMADEEANAIRENARRDAETIRGTASTEAEQTRNEAEARAEALRQECAELINDLEQQRAHLAEQRSQQMSEIDSQREEMHRASREKYEEAMTAAHRDATELLHQTQQRCQEMEAASEAYHASVVEDIEARATKLDEFRRRILETLGAMHEFAGTNHAVVVQLAVPGLSAASDQQSSGDRSHDSTAESADRSGGRVHIPVQAGYDGAQGGHGQLPVSAVVDDDIVGEDIPVSTTSRTHSGMGHSVRPAEQRS